VSIIIRAVLVGMLVAIVGTIPRNILFFANLKYFANVPWAAPLIAVYIWFFWKYLTGSGPPRSTAQQRRVGLRANRISGRAWAWSLLAGGLSIVALVIALGVLNRLIVLPAQQLPALEHVPAHTMVSLLLIAAPVAGIIEEAAFRGYMQGPLERRYGLPVAILITGTMFAVAHLDFTLILWPYYVAVAAIYGTVTYLSQSILPAIVLHTAGNIYSNLNLWLYGHAEWQWSAQTTLIWNSGPDTSFWVAVASMASLTALSIWAHFRLAAVARESRPVAGSGCDEE
jgi:membrane protease YdiL (CAAX protease family)